MRSIKRDMRRSRRRWFCVSVIVLLHLAGSAASGAGKDRDWSGLLPDQPVETITITAERPSAPRAELAVYESSRLPSEALPILRYNLQDRRETTALLIVAALAEPLRRLDQHVIATATTESAEHPKIEAVSHTLTDLGNWPAMGVVCAALYAGGDSRSRHAAQDFASAGLTTTVMVGLLKRTVQRPRPNEPGDGSGDTSFSFPSGHAASAFSAATVIAHHYPDLREPAYVGAALISVSRVALRRHYPTDVAAGALVGILVTKQVLKHNGNLLEWRW
ncbi:MAG: phosphatase PAP2 family protein [Armatimonadota bacterium]|nr:MAG: phosphatase PAP2 family protein [Armatimonadota bacterium]